MASDSRGYRRNVKRRLLAESLENRIVLASDLAIVAGGEALVTHLPAQNEGLPEITSIAAGMPNGDLNGDGDTNAADIDAIAEAIRTDNQSTAYDVDGSGVVDKGDMDMLVHTIIGTDYGDANLDLVIDADDHDIWMQNRYQYDRGWALGDFNGDNAVDASDFNIWNSHRVTTNPTVTLTGTQIIRSAHPANMITSTTTDDLFNASQIQSRGIDNGDFNGDASLDATDIDMLATAIREDSTDSIYDLNEDGTVDTSDLDMMVKDLLNTSYGDHDLNGVVNNADLVAVTDNIFQSGTGWATGDYNGDGATDVSDFNRWNENRVSEIRTVVSSNSGESLNTESKSGETSSIVGDTTSDTTSRFSRFGEGEMNGDLNGDTEINADDIDMLAHAIRTGDQTRTFDLNEDKFVNQADMDMLIHDMLDTEYGDANLDGVVDRNDFDTWQENSYRADTGWASADFNGDGVTDVSDHNVWNENRVSTAPVVVTQTGVSQGDEEKEDNNVTSKANTFQLETIETSQKAQEKVNGMKFRYMRFM